MYGFKIKRAEQVEGVKRIAKMSDYAKKYAMIKVLLEKMFKVSRLFLNLPFLYIQHFSIGNYQKLVFLNVNGDN